MARVCISSIKKKTKAKGDKIKKCCLKLLKMRKWNPKIIVLSNQREKRTSHSLQKNNNNKKIGRGIKVGAIKNLKLFVEVIIL